MSSVHPLRIVILRLISACPQSAKAQGRHAPSPPSVPPSSEKALKPRYNTVAAPYPGYETHESYRASRKYGANSASSRVFAIKIVELMSILLLEHQHVASAISAVPRHILNMMTYVRDRDTPTVVTTTPASLAM